MEGNPCGPLHPTSLAGGTIRRPTDGAGLAKNITSLGLAWSPDRQTGPHLQDTSHRPVTSRSMSR